MTIYAEDVNYWQTSTIDTDSWLEKAKVEIKRVGGQVKGSAVGTDDEIGRAAVMLEFSIGDDTFKVMFPTLLTRTGNTKAALRQAATALYYDVKAKCVLAKFLGIRSAFLSYLMLPGGIPAAQAANVDLLQLMPGFLLPSGLKVNRPSDEVVEG